MADVVVATDQIPVAVVSSTPVQPASVTDPTTLNRADLADYALSEFNLPFKSAATKTEILAAIAAVQGPVAKYRVKRPLLHDNKPYGVGAIISLAATAAASLVRTQVVEPATETVSL